MSHQLTFADSEFSSKRRQTRKEIFLSRMEQILPWQNMVEVIEPFYPKAGNGRRPYPLETMLRIHCMQHWYNLSDGAMEDALYEIASMRLFARLSLDSAPAGPHHHHEFPPPAGAASTGPPIVQDHQSLAGRSRRHDDSRHLGRCHHH